MIVLDFGDFEIRFKNEIDLNQTNIFVESREPRCVTALLTLETLVGCLRDYVKDIPDDCIQFVKNDTTTICERVKTGERGYGNNMLPAYKDLLHREGN